MKIAIVSRGDIPSYWGHSINIMKHAQGFHKLNHTIEILTVQHLIERKLRAKIKDIHSFYGINQKIKIRFFNDYSLLNFKDLKVFRSFKKYFIKYTSKFKNPLDSRKIKLLKMENRDPSIFNTIMSKCLKNLFTILNFNDSGKKISKYCLKNKFDLVYCRSYNSTYYNIINKIPTILETHYPNINNPIFKKLVRLSNNNFFKGIITIHKILKSYLISAGVPSEKVFVLEDAVDFDKFDEIHQDKQYLRKQLKLPLNKKIILYAGSLQEGRGIDTIINAAKTLNNSDLVYIILGGNKYNILKWKSYLKKAGIRDYISFLGFKENKLIPFYYKSADILLAPYSLKCATVKWMSPIKLFEYMASKVPIIASDVKRIKEICNNDECLLFKHDDSIDLSKQIQYLLENNELRERLIENAYKRSKDFTYNLRCQKILNKYTT